MSEDSKLIEAAFKRIDELKILLDEVRSIANSALKLAQHIGQSHAEILGLLNTHKTKVEGIVKNWEIKMEENLKSQNNKIQNILDLQDSRIMSLLDVQSERNNTKLSKEVNKIIFWVIGSGTTLALIGYLLKG